MIAYPIGYPIGCLTGDPKGDPNRPRIARIESCRVMSCRPLLKTRVAGNTTSFRNVMREPRDAMVEALTRQIYHYTCDDHGRPGIERDGVIRPGLDGFAWFTDLDVPHREALGLTMHYTRCDRTAHRFEVDPDDPALTPWTVARRAVPPAYRAALEASPGALLRHWFVSKTPVRVIA